MEEQRTIIVHKRLRPLRLAFLVPPNNPKILRRVCQAATCLWGGKGSLIFPVYHKTPKSWAQGRYVPSAKSILLGALDSFEPDYVVVETTLPKGVQLPDKRQISLTDVLTQDAEHPVNYGLDVSEIYAELYQREFTFERRHPIQVVIPRLAQRALSLLGAACFGEFPPDKHFTYLQTEFCEAFGASAQVIAPTAFFDFYIGGNPCPLSLGSALLKRERIERHQLFFLDPRSLIDLMDFWNLRALGKRVIPIPLPLADAMVPACARFITDHYVPHPHNKEIMLCTTVIRSRSTTEEQLRHFTNQLQIPDGALGIQNWYPRFWDEWARDKDDVELRVVTAEKVSETVTEQDGRIQFSDLEIPFATRTQHQTTPRWVSVITLSERAIGAAPVIPPGISPLERILEDHSLHTPIWATREGIVIPSSFVSVGRFWKMPTAERLFQGYMQQRGFKLRISGAGQIAAQVIRTLGTWGASLLENEELLKLLNNMAHERIVVDDPESGKAGVPAKVRARTVPARDLTALLLRACDNYAEAANNHLNALVTKGVVRLGLRLRCPSCSQSTWFAVDQLSTELQCERCLTPFSFPTVPPKHEQWHYRALGSFTIENYAQGGYCVALALHFLGPQLRDSDLTWIPAFTLHKQESLDLEADFAAFWQGRRYGRAQEPLLVLAESKSFEGQFSSRDVGRMRRLAEAFPGSVIAFCTLRKELTTKEKRLIIPLVNYGRRHLRGDRWRNPVLVLTGIELLERWGPPSCWKNAGPEYAKFEDQFWRREGLQDLCDMTQQMHLGMEPRSAWYEKEWRKRRNRSRGANYAKSEQAAIAT